MRRTPDLPALLRTISMVGVGAWLMWQLLNIVPGLAGTTTSIKLWVLAVLVLLSVLIGLRRLRLANSPGWQRTDVLLIGFVLVLLAFEGLFAPFGNNPRVTAINIAPWSVDSARPADTQLAQALEADWRERLWQQSAWRPVTWYALDRAAPPAGDIVQTSLVFQDQTATLRVSLGEASSSDALISEQTERHGTQAAMMLNSAIDAVNRRFRPPTDIATTLPASIGPGQHELDCARADSTIQQAAVTALRATLYAEPEMPLNHATLANCLLRLILTTPEADPALRHEARASANRALVLQAELTSAKRTVASIAWHIDANPMKALELWREVLEIYPYHAGVRLDVASLLFTAGLTNAAMQEVVLALDTAPDHPQAQYLLALEALQQEDPQRAMMYLSSALAIVPQSVEYRMALALAYEQLNENGQISDVFAPLSGDDIDQDTQAYRSWSLALAGDSAAAAGLKDQLFENDKPLPGRAYRHALVALGSGQAEAANRAWQAARQAADPRVLWPVNRLLFKSQSAADEMMQAWQTALQNQDIQENPP